MPSYRVTISGDTATIENQQEGPFVRMAGIDLAMTLAAFALLGGDGTANVTLGDNGSVAVEVE
jgi:hypothetical protein